MPNEPLKSITIDDLSKGLNTFDPETRVPKGFYVDAQNMVFSNTKNLQTIGGLTRLNTTVVPSGNVVWVEPYTDGAGVTTYLAATSTGRLYRYTVSGDVWRHVLQGLTTGANTWVHVPFRGIMFFTNGVDESLKWDGTNVVPIGAMWNAHGATQLVADFESDENALWVGGTIRTTSPKEGVQSREIDTTVGVGNLSLTYSADRDFLTGILGAPNFDAFDDFDIWFRRTSGVGASAFRFSFGNAADTAYFSRSETLNPVDSNWTRLRINRSDFTVGAGAPVWSAIRKFAVHSDTVGHIYEFDWAYWRYDAATSNQLLVVDMEVDESWVGGTADTSPVFEGIQSRELVNVTSAALTFSADRDMSGGGDSDPADTFDIQYQRTAGAGATTVRIRLGNTADTNYFEASLSLNPVNGTWNLSSTARSLFSTTGSPVWTAIRKITIFQDTGVQTYNYDFGRFIFAGTTTSDGPPLGEFIEMYAQQLIVGGVSGDLVQVRHSDAGSPDFFPAANFARFSGGRHALEEQDRITALRSYFDELVVGKVNSAWTFSGTGTNTSISALPLTIGITSNRAIVETPWSLHFLYDNNIFGARLTSRGLVSTNISSLLRDVDNSVPQAHIGIRHDRSHTVRWSFRDVDVASENTIGLVYEYQLDAWVSQYTPRISYYTRALISGNRELLAVQYDGFIRRVDVGTDFDGTAIVSFVTLPWMQSQEMPGNIVIWKDVQIYKRGGATVNIDARFADDPTEFAGAAFTTFESTGATPDSDKQYSYIGRTSRWMQLRLRATSLAFEILMPMTVRYIDRESRV